jgi:hypothetical protein
MPENNQNDPKRGNQNKDQGQQQRKPMQPDKEQGQEQVRRPGQGNQNQGDQSQIKPDKNIDEDLDEGLDEDQVTGRQPRVNE